MTHEGDVAASLGCYPLEFRFDGESYEGFGVGAVHTAPDFRGEGYARQLVRRVQQHSVERRDQIGLLFSDIDPGFYEELGYSVESDRRFDTDRLRPLAEGGERAGLHPLDPEERLEEMMIWYDDWSGDQRLTLARDRSYWRATLRETPDHDYFGVSPPGGDEMGYIRVEDRDGRLEVLELVLPESGARDRAAAYRALADLALARNWSRIRQHFPPPRPLLSHFDDNRRDEMITMLIPAGERVAFDENWLRANATIWPADRF